MNRRRSDTPQSHFALYFSIIVFAVVASGGGVSYAIFMNRQVETTREIHRVEERIKERELESLTIQMRTGELLNRYKIREELAQQQTSLEPIPQGVVENVRPAQTPAVVSTLP